MSSNDFTVDYDELVDQLVQCQGLKKSVSEAAGSLRERIKTILESSEYHKQAFAMIRAIEDMSDTKRADFLRCFRPMFEAMFDGKWRGDMMDLVDRAEAAADELEDA